MGVPGLWDVLNKVGKSTSLAHLAVVEGFESNRSGRRAYRIGIDVSIWFHHASFSKEGENCRLRNLFFRLKFLASLPLIPLFVFDGRQRPKVKRASRLGKSGSHGLSKQFKEFLDAFGMEWREALGEAEAELAFLNRDGHIDAIMTDDCDAFLFGACTVIKNISKKLSGNKNNLALNADDKTDNYHTMVYKIADIRSHAEVSMTRGGMILFALLSGDDYHGGVERFGKVIAHSLARCGFGDELLEAYENLQGQDLQEFLHHWRERVNAELRANTLGFLPHRTSLSLPIAFPELDVLEKYANPTHSTSGRNGSVALRDVKNLDLGRVASLCEQYFEWGYRDRIIERFRTLMWPAAVMHVLRRAALEADDEARRRSSVCGREVGTPASIVQQYLGAVNKIHARQEMYADVFVNRTQTQERTTPNAGPHDSHPIITSMVGSRQHPSTGHLLEYRVEISPIQLVTLTNAGIQDTRSHPPETTPSKTDRNSALRLWIPATILQRVHPSMVEHYILEKTRKKGKGKARAPTPLSDSEEEHLMPSSSQTRAPSQGQHAASTMAVPRSSPEPSVIRVVLDPWFTSEFPESRPPRRGTSRGFLFTFENPDMEDPELGVDEGGFGFALAQEAQDDQELDERPLTNFDRLCDRILFAPSKSKKSTKKRTSHQDMAPPRLPTKRPRISTGSAVLDILDLTMT
ncbi:unnamed protein product [Cyclocybe aegerita]|uniref:XPG-I domain-containing protein n=1 Tax=Cyclocybe aegerita TaxID=1973307 RepID=A0A8S0VWE8_CYCAE|nr:unnamed protein product [Cyclocybe aegerita]